MEIMELGFSTRSDEILSSLIMLLDHKKFGLKRIMHPSQVHKLITMTIGEMQPFDRDKEFFFVIGLTRANTLKYYDMVSMGSLKSTVAEPREVFRHAILHATASIMVAHNHPSGNIQPSQSDIAITKVLYESGKVLCIPLIDHIIVTEKEWYSFANEGLLW